MRKFLVMFAVLAVIAAASLITGPHAEADDDLPPAPIQRANCSTFDNVKSDSKTVPVGTVNAEWRVYVWLWWRHCTNGLEARQYRVKFVPVNPGNCFRIDEWRVNPNIIGNYNPGTRILNCDGDDPKTATWDLHQEFVPNGSNASDRCLGAKVTVGIIGASDSSFQVPSLCVPLT